MVIPKRLNRPPGSPPNGVPTAEEFDTLRRDFRRLNIVSRPIFYGYVKEYLQSPEGSGVVIAIKTGTGPIVTPPVDGSPPIDTTPPTQTTPTAGTFTATFSSTF
jgi:hypothetical protein